MLRVPPLRDTAPRRHRLRFSKPDVAFDPRKPEGDTLAVGARCIVPTKRFGARLELCVDLHRSLMH